MKLHQDVAETTARRSFSRKAKKRKPKIDGLIRGFLSHFEPSNETVNLRLDTLLACALKTDTVVVRTDYEDIAYVSASLLNDPRFMTQK